MNTLTAIAQLRLEVTLRQRTRNSISCHLWEREFSRDLEGVLVEWIQGGQRYSFRPGLPGLFQLPAHDGKGLLKISIRGYLPTCKKIEVPVLSDQASLEFEFSPARSSVYPTMEQTL